MIDVSIASFHCDSLADVGFMTRNEMNSLLSINSDVNLYWVPGVWFIHLLREAKKEGRIRDAQGLKLITEVNSFKNLNRENIY